MKIRQALQRNANAAHLPDYYKVILITFMMLLYHTVGWGQVVRIDPLEFVSPQMQTITPNKQSPCENVIPQLKNYPLPRYKTGNNLNKNYPWLPANCLSNSVDHTIQIQNNGYNRETNINVSNASAFLELARHWNYYFPLALNTKDGYTLSTQILTDSGNLAQNYPLKTCATTYWPQTSIDPTQQPLLPNPNYPLKPDLRGRFTPPPRKMREPNPTTPNIYYVCDEDNYFPGYIFNKHLAAEYYLHRIDTTVEGMAKKEWAYFENAEPRYILKSDHATCQTKLLSPLAPVPTYSLDGTIASYQLDLLNSVITRPTPIDMVNENGETEHIIASDQNDPGRNRAGDILRQAHIVDVDYANNYFGGGLTNKRKMHYYFTEGVAHRYDAYTSLNKQTYPNTLFTMYQQEGNPDSRHEWNVMRNTMPDFMKNNVAYKYSTPQYYPFQQFWKWGCCAFDGLDFTEDSREREVFRTDFNNTPLAPDTYYSPFVAAGWEADEEFNIRPAQWLGLMKNHVMMGAEFFYTGFFGGHFFKSAAYPTYNGINTTDLNSANWVWQTSTPSYAQALTTYVNDFYFDSELLWRMIPDPNNPNPQAKPIRDADLITNVPNKWDYPLASARKHKLSEEYLLSVTLQPKEDESIKGTGEPLIPRNPASNEYPVTIDLPRNNAVGASIIPITVNARRQGSTYFLDNDNPTKKIFYQLDGWHEWKHPQHWNKDSIVIEAELYDADPQTNTNIATECHSCATTGNPYNFTDFVTYTNSGNAEYKFEVRAGGCIWGAYTTVRSGDIYNTQGATFELTDDRGQTVFTDDIQFSGLKINQPIPNPAPFNWQKKYIGGDRVLRAGTYTLKITQRSPDFHIDKVSLEKFTFDCGCQ